MSGAETSLREYYDEEARRLTRRYKGPLRISLQERFVELLHGEQRRSVIDIGSGPGLDTVVFRDAGFSVVGVDLAPENVRLMQARGLQGVGASLYELPFEPDLVEAVWTMSTLVHVPDERFDEALCSITSIAVPVAPIGIGTWGGFDWEGVSERDEIVPARFFSLRTHDRLRAMLGEHGTVELFETYRPNPDTDWEYQFAILRIS